jgi:hypothetical protein
MTSLPSPGELLEHHVLGRAHAVAQVDVLEPGIGRLEHLDVLLVPRRDLADGALAGLGQVEEDAEAQ